MANEPTTQPVITSIEGAVLAVKLDNLKDQVGEIVKVMAEMQRTMQTLVQIEREQRDFSKALDRAFGEIKAERDKLVQLSIDLNREMPGLRAVRKWAIILATSGAGMLGVALMTLLVINPLYRGYGTQSSPMQTFIVPPQQERQK